MLGESLSIICFYISNVLGGKLDHQYVSGPKLLLMFYPLNTGG